MPIKAKKPDDIVFTDATKHKRAIDVLNMILNKPVTPHIMAEYSPEGRQQLRDKFVALLGENKIDPAKDYDTALRFVYKKLGGGILTYEKQQKLKARADKNKISNRSQEKPAEDDDESDNDTEDDEDKDDVDE